MSPELSEALAALNARLDRIERTVSEVRSLVGPFGVPFPDGSMLVQTLHGTKYFIDPNDEVMAPQLVVYRQWEPDLSAFVMRSVTPDTVFVDVGANFGYFTCLAGARIGAGGRGRVVAVEPNPKMFDLLGRNVEVNWSMAPVTCHACAVGAAAGCAEFEVPGTRAANARLAPTGAAGSARRFVVRVAPLDDLLGDELVVDLMKIDVEGFEAAVFDGAMAALGRSPRVQIVMEWSLRQMAEAGYSADDLLQRFGALGLRAHRLPEAPPADEAGWDALALPESALSRLDYGNILLRRPG